MSNRMLAVASGVALAVVTQRTPIIDWSSLFPDDRFGRSPPRGLIQQPLPSPRNELCTLRLGHTSDQTACWAVLADFYEREEWDLRGLMPSCQVLHVQSNQQFLPLLLGFRVRGGPSLGSILATHGREPLTVLVAALFRPDPALAAAVSAFRDSLAHGGATGERRRGRGARAAGAGPVLITVHVRYGLLAERKKALGPSVVPSIANCTAAWAARVRATHVYVGSDNPDTAAAVMNLLPVFGRAFAPTLPPLAVLGFSDLEAFALKSGLLEEHNPLCDAAALGGLGSSSGSSNGDGGGGGGGGVSSLRFATSARSQRCGRGAYSGSVESGRMRCGDLADSLTLGSGAVCIGTPRSTFSKVATQWWGAERCGVLVEAGSAEVGGVKPKGGGRSGCAVVGTRPWAMAWANPTARAGGSGDCVGAAALAAVAENPELAPDPPLAEASATASADASASASASTSACTGTGESAFSGHLASETLGCGGRGCPVPLAASAASLRLHCPRPEAEPQGAKQGRNASRALRLQGSSRSDAFWRSVRPRVVPQFCCHLRSAPDH